MNKYYVVKAILLCNGVLTFLDRGSTFKATADTLQTKSKILNYFDLFKNVEAEIGRKLRRI